MKYQWKSLGTCYRNTGVGNDSKTDPVSKEIMSMNDTLHLEKLKAFLQQRNGKTTE